MVKVIVIPQDEEQPLDVREVNGLGDMQAIVGGLIEPIDIDRPSATIMVNEEGLILDLPVNRRASLLLWVGNSRYRGLSAVRGDAFVIGLPDDEGDSTDVPEELENLLTKVTEFKYLVTVIGDPDTWCGNQRRFTDVWDTHNAALIKASQWALCDEVKIVPA